MSEVVTTIEEQFAAWKVEDSKFIVETPLPVLAPARLWVKWVRLSRLAVMKLQPKRMHVRLLRSNCPGRIMVLL